MQRIHRSRSGLAAVLAMLFLCLLAVLAVGFFSQTSLSGVVSENDRRGIEASLAAESGMAFMRQNLAQVTIPHGTPTDQCFNAIYTQLGTLLNGTLNMAGHDITMNGDIIYVPGGGSTYVSLADGAKWRAVIENGGQQIFVTAYGFGSNASLQRAIRLRYDLTQKASEIFDYGVASKGKISTAGSSKIIGQSDPTKGSLLSTCMTDPAPVVAFGKIISGDVSISNPNGLVPIGASTSIGGSTDPAVIAKHVHKGVASPEFPVVDTTIYEPFVANTFEAGMTNLVNCRIPANTNPIFAGQVTITGVLYVETPNNIQFRGNTDIKGVIVVQNNPTGTVSTNQLNFSGNVSAQGTETLDESVALKTTDTGATLDLRKLTGAFILAPNFFVTFTGDFGTVSGSILSSKYTMSGNAQGTIKGSVVNLENNPMTITGSSEIVIASTGTSNFPAGVYFSSNYVPKQDTYEEVAP